MKQYSINAIIPALDREGFVVIPLSWKMGPNNDQTVNTCFKLSKDEAKELAQRLERILK